MITQKNKVLSIETPLGKDVLLLDRFTGQEGLSENFHFYLDLFSQQNSIFFEDIIGKNVTISISLANGDKRYLNGLISCFSQVQGNNYRASYYSATMVPWTWLLTRTSNSRIFQDLSVPDIVEKVFLDKGFTDFKFNLSTSYDPREYTVQYRETDFNFVSRLLEDEGIYYYFEHEQGQHTMILADHSGTSKPCRNQPSAKFKQSGDENFENEDQIYSLTMKKQIQAGKYTLNDYNYEIPNTNLKVTSDTIHALGPGEREKYDHPGGYIKRNAGDTVSVLRMEEEETRITTFSGTSDCRAFTSGRRFKLENPFQDDWTDKEYLLTHVTHKADQAATYASESSIPKPEKIYTNEFKCIPHEVTFRPPLTTPIPVVEGVQTAVTVGPANEEIYTDGFGRVKVQFHWDREGQRNEHSSCWLRVSQSMAGPCWGAVVLPRVGHEVIVEFIEGNPDRPIVTGQVYHATNRPPYNLPGEKTRTTFKSNSSPGGGGFNEIRFEDKAGSEEIYFHGQKDWDIVMKNNKSQKIGNNETMNVGHNRTKSVGTDQSETIGKNKTINVGKDHNETIASNMTLGVGADRTVNIASNENKTVGKSSSETVGKNKSVNVGTASSETIGLAKALSIGAAYQITVGGAMNETVGGLKAEEVGISKTVVVAGNFSETVGNTHKLKAKKIVIQADEDITLKTGAASIVMTSDGTITIKGTQISQN